MIFGQRTQELLYIMKQDINWETVSISYDTLALIDIIDKKLLVHTEDQYPFAIFYGQELSLYGFQKNTLTNNQQYEKFNTNMDVGSTIGVTRQHGVLLKRTSQKVNSKDFFAIHDSEKEKIRSDAKERYLEYTFIKQSTRTDNKSRTNLSDDYTTGENKYPVTRQETFH